MLLTETIEMFVRSFLCRPSQKLFFCCSFGWLGCGINFQLFVVRAGPFWAILFGRSLFGLPSYREALSSSTAHTFVIKAYQPFLRPHLKPQAQGQLRSRKGLRVVYGILSWAGGLVSAGEIGPATSPEAWPRPIENRVGL